MRLARLLLVIAAPPFLAGCDEDSGVVDVTFDEYQVDATPEPVTLDRYRTQNLAVTVTNTTENRQVASPEVTYHTTASSVATVNSSGRITAVKEGTAQIIVRYAGLAADTIDVTVNANPITSGTAWAADSSLGPGDTVTVKYEFKDASGTVISRPVTFSSSNTSVATVATTGRVTARDKSGTATITVKMDEFSATVPITVTETPTASVSVSPESANLKVGASLALTAEAFSATGAELADRAFVWSSSDPNVASVDQTGKVTGVAVSAVPVVITATYGGHSDTSVITVVP